ncbi:MAG: lectin-like protein, partial [Candidatus Cloacimonetes bacterium]|nr:lectin-like protein [Candidatus Cloacimonadota bacterium]
KVHFYYGELSNNIHQISIVLSDPDINQIDTLNYITVYNNIPESVDLFSYRFIGQFSDNFYFIGDSVLIWDRADSLAQASNMHLVTITSESENTFIKFALPTENYYEYENYWVGLFFNTETLMVDWVTGEPVEYTGYLNQSLMPDNEKKYGYVYRDDWYNDNLFWGAEVSADSSSSWQNRKNYIAEYEGNLE